MVMASDCAIAMLIAHHIRQYFVMLFIILEGLDHALRSNRGIFGSSDEEQWEFNLARNSLVVVLDGRVESNHALHWEVICDLFHGRDTDNSITAHGVSDQADTGFVDKFESVVERRVSIDRLEGMFNVKRVVWAPHIRADFRRNHHVSVTSNDLEKLEVAWV